LENETHFVSCIIETSIASSSVAFLIDENVLCNIQGFPDSRDSCDMHLDFGRALEIRLGLEIPFTLPALFILFS
jgi:hypothetical protein